MSFLTDSCGEILWVQWHSNLPPSIQDCYLEGFLFDTFANTHRQSSGVSYQGTDLLGKYSGTKHSKRNTLRKQERSCVRLTLNEYSQFHDERLNGPASSPNIGPFVNKVSHECWNDTLSMLDSSSAWTEVMPSPHSPDETLRVFGYSRLELVDVQRPTNPRAGVHNVHFRSTSDTLPTQCPLATLYNQLRNQETFPGVDAVLECLDETDEESLDQCSSNLHSSLSVFEAVVRESNRVFSGTPHYSRQLKNLYHTLSGYVSRKLPKWQAVLNFLSNQASRGSLEAIHRALRVADAQASFDREFITVSSFHHNSIQG